MPSSKEMEKVPRSVQVWTTGCKQRCAMETGSRQHIACMSSWLRLLTTMPFSMYGFVPLLGRLGLLLFVLGIPSVVPAPVGAGPAILPLVAVELWLRKLRAASWKRGEALLLRAQTARARRAALQSDDVEAPSILLENQVKTEEPEATRNQLKKLKVRVQRDADVDAERQGPSRRMRGQAKRASSPEARGSAASSWRRPCLAGGRPVGEQKRE